MSSTRLLVATISLLVTTLSSSSFVKITEGTCYLQDNSRWPIYESTGTDCATAGTSFGWSGTNTIVSGSISNTVRGCSTIAAAATGPVTPGVTEGANVYENAVETTVSCGDTIRSKTFGDVQTTCACFVGPACKDATTNTDPMSSDCMCNPDYYATDSSDGLKIGRNILCSAGTYCYQNGDDVGVHTSQPTCSDTLYPTCCAVGEPCATVTVGSQKSCVCGNRNDYIICSNDIQYCKNDPFGTPTCVMATGDGGGGSSGDGDGDGGTNVFSAVVCFIVVMMCAAAASKKLKRQSRAS